MTPLNELFLFAGAALLMVLTPGPNMIYLMSHSIGQGRKAASWFSRNPTWLVVQRYFMGFVLAALAVRLAIEQR